MTANLLNTLLGLWLAYVAIFPATIGAHYHRWLVGAAIITAVLAFWAQKGDYARWQSNMTMVAAAVLVVIAGADRFLVSSPVLLFWGVLWVGLVSATMSLWAALYQPESAASATT
jgi:hypothetical protein